MDARTHLLQQMAALVQSGKLTITLVVGPPRTVTTALAAALGQAPEIGHSHVYHECFTNCQHAPLQTATAQLQDAEEPQHWVIKEMSHLVGIEDLLPLCKHVVLTTREPMQHAFALTDPKTYHATALENYALADILELQNTSMEHIGHALKHPDQSNPFLSKQLKESAVSNVTLRNLYSQIEQRNNARYIPDGKKPTLSVVEGDSFRIAPEETLRSLAERSDITFQNHMAHAWHGKHSTGNDAWCRTFHNSSGIKRPKQEAPYADGLYEAIDYAERLQNYLPLISSAARVRPSLSKEIEIMGRPCEITQEKKGEACTQQAMRFLMARQNEITGDGAHANTQTKAIRFDALCPPTAYANIACYTQLNEADRTAQQSYLRTLRQEHPNHAPAFDAIDAWMERALTPEKTVQKASANLMQMAGKYLRIGA